MAEIKDIELVDELNVALRKLFLAIEMINGVVVQTNDKQLRFAYEGLVVILEEVADSVSQVLDS